MKFKTQKKGSVLKQKQPDSVKHYRFDASDASLSPTPFATQKDLQSSQIGGFIKKSKSTFKLNSSEPSGQRIVMKAGKDNKKKQKSLKRLKLQEGPLKKMGKLPTWEPTEFIKAHKKTNKLNKSSIETAVSETTDISEEQKKKTYGKESVRSQQTAINLQEKQILGNKKMSKKKKQNSFREISENALDESQQHNMSKKKSKKLQKSMGLSNSEERNVPISSVSNVDDDSSNPKKKKKRKNVFPECTDEQISGNDSPFKCGMLMQIKKKSKTNSGRPVQPDREIGKSILNEVVEFVQQPSVPCQNNDASKTKTTDDQVKFQGKKKKRKEQSFSENSDVDVKEAGSSENFQLDYVGSENVKQKKKKQKKKNSKSSFEDTSSIGLMGKVKARRSDTPDEILQTTSVAGDDLSEASKKDSSGFIGLTKKTLRGFEGREDTPERLARTVFVGNLPLSVDKKVLHLLFQSFGLIESVRLRSAVPAKSSVPKKVALIRKEFHKESDSVNAYVVFKTSEDAKQSLTLNKTVFKGHHIRVDLMKNNNQYDSQHSVFVGNLPYNIPDESLWVTFGVCGNIEAVRIVRDPETGAGKGFGFVLFENKDSVKDALLLNNTEVNGRNIRVKVVESGNKLKEKAPEEKRKIASSKMEKKNVRKSGWRLAGQKKTKKKMIKKQKDMQKKKRITSILTPK